MSIGGALLAQLGATAMLVGVVSGAADALALGLRIVTGPWVDRTRAYWAFTITGYAMSFVAVPLLAVTPLLGAAALAVASLLLLLERTGKAVRAPAKTVLLASPARAVGSGRGFAVHKLLDQIGALSGPLVVAGVVALTGALWPAFAVLVVPSLVALAVLLWLRSRVPDTRVYDSPADDPAHPSPPAPASRWSKLSGLGALPVPVRRRFVAFAGFTALTEFGLFSFGLVSFHLATKQLVPIAAVPLVYALAMAVAAVAALATGWTYDKIGPAVLIVVPIITAFVPALALGPTIGLVLVGVALWGAAGGIQDSTIKALIADLVPARGLGAAYGWSAVVQGIGAMAGAWIAGALYGHLTTLVTIVAILQLLALLALIPVVRRRDEADTPKVSRT